MDVKTAADRAGVTRRTMYQWIKDGKIEATKTNEGEWEISAEAIAAIVGRSDYEASVVHTVMAFENNIDRQIADSMKKIRAYCDNFSELYDAGNANAELSAVAITAEGEKIKQLRFAKKFLNEISLEEMTPFEEIEGGDNE